MGVIVGSVTFVSLSGRNELLSDSLEVRDASTFRRGDFLHGLLLSSLEMRKKNLSSGVTVF